jgi:hypothetical protein
MTDSEGNEPSQESIKASIRQGEASRFTLGSCQRTDYFQRTDAPPVAEAAESE